MSNVGREAEQYENGEWLGRKGAIHLVKCSSDAKIRMIRPAVWPRLRGKSWHRSGTLASSPIATVS